MLQNLIKPRFSPGAALPAQGSILGEGQVLVQPPPIARYTGENKSPSAPLKRRLNRAKQPRLFGANLEQLPAHQQARSRSTAVHPSAGFGPPPHGMGISPRPLPSRAPPAAPSPGAASLPPPVSRVVPPHAHRDI